MANDASNDLENCAIENKTNSEVKVINTIKLPVFLQTDPELWFTQVDGILHLNRITSDVSKYYTVITALDSDTLRQVSDIAKNPPEQGKYDKLRTELINRFSESKERQLSKLLVGLELGEKKPSQLLREMRELAGLNVSAEGLQTLWLQRMPSNIRCILSACTAENLDTLCDIADRIKDNLATSTLSIAETSYAQRENCKKISLQSIESRLFALETSMQHLVNKVTELTLNKNEERSSRSINRSNSRYRSNSNTRRHQKVCYYHIKFGSAATKCQQPCEFSSNANATAPGN